MKKLCFNLSNYICKLYCDMLKNIAQMIDLKWNSGLQTYSHQIYILNDYRYTKI